MLYVLNKHVVDRGDWMQSGCAGTSKQKSIRSKLSFLFPHVKAVCFMPFMPCSEGAQLRPFVPTHRSAVWVAAGRR